MVVEFKPRVFQYPYTPYYDKYKGHKFIIDHRHEECDDHVWLLCVTDPNVIVNGYVHFYDLIVLEK